MPKKRIASDADGDGESPAAELQRRFGQNFRACRKQAGLTQAQISKLTGITQKLVWSIESGQQNLTIRQMQRLAQAVNREVVELLAVSSETPPSKK